MAKITINDDLCKGCGLCVGACPKKILELEKSRLNSKGYHPVHNVDMDSLGNVWDFLLSMFKFFENLIRWFFALTPFKQ